MKNQFKKFLKENNFPKGRAVCGYISRSGKFHLCQPFGHYGLERKLKKSAEELLDRGWIKVTANHLFFNYCNRKLQNITSKQKDTLFDWADATENMKRYSEFMEEYKEWHESYSKA